ncbi:MAG TPA: NAD(P)/FAD-dependent oxidoreductase [Candidatus Acidoferrales bacterium]|nr:NAD(P)/FAD-dependent oxidoreductase [Candidatus Acidoferrales bacterium]
MGEIFDLIVIGTGEAGSAAAYTCREAGWTVAIIDKQPFGGTCALRGCDPKKILVGVADLADWYTRMQGRGIVGEHVRIDWPALMRFKRSFTDPVPEDREQGFREAGIVTYHGVARFVDRTTIQADGRTLTGRYIVIAAGARPQTLRIPGEEFLTTSTQFLELEALPVRIVFVGGGYIAAEFAHVAARAGAQVTIIHRGTRPLERFDADLVAQWQRATQEAGIRLELNAAVRAVEKKDNRLIVHAIRGDEEYTWEADMVVHAAGRVPEIDELDLAKGNVQAGTRGVVVNDFLQSASNPVVYAGGDSAATDGLPLTPVAAYDGKVIAANLLRGNHRKPDYSVIPTVVFSLPPLAAVGLSEQAAKDRGLRFTVRHEDTSDWYSSRRIGIKYSSFKVLVDEENERILGAHVFGPHADDVINLFALAMRSEVKASQVRRALYSYPSVSGDVRYMV